MQQIPQLATPPGAGTGSTDRVKRLVAGALDNDGRRLWWLALWLACFVLLAHAILIAGGRWDGDEFFNFAQYRQSGVPYLFFRTLHWSPRPVSEFVLYLYALAVLHWNAPLITPFLGTLWATLIAATAAAGWVGGRDGRLARVSAALTLAAMFLLGHQINEMFFWPMAATPYLIALAAMVVAAFAVIRGHTMQPAGRGVTAVALSIAVLSSETGLFLTLVFAAGLWLLERWPGKNRTPDHGGTLWYLLPVALSLGVLVCELCFRVGDATTGVGPTQAYFHRAWPSFVAALQTAPRELVLNDRSTDGLPDAASWVMQGLLLVGFYCVCATGWFPRARWQHTIALAVALPGTVGLMVFASFYQYGAWGFERHRTFCQCLDVLLLLVLGRMAAQWLPPPRRLQPIGALSLSVAMALAMTVRLPAIVHDDTLLPEIRKARDMTWDSGNATGTTAMRYTLPPGGDVLEPSVWQVGHFSVAPGSGAIPWYASGVLAFFGKKSIDIVSAPTP